MCITAYSLVMGCIWASILTIIMRMIQKGKRTLQYFGVCNLLILYLFCIFRMTVSIELPVTKVVSVKNVYNAVTRFCMKKGMNGMVCVGDLILLIWCCGTVIKLFWLIRDYRNANRMLCVCTMKREGMACELLEQLQSEMGDKRNIKIYMTPFDMPMEMGIFHPAILLPDRGYKEQNLYYIMKHEYTHILNHDAVVKLLINLWRCIFWWNPIAYLIHVDIEDTLELKCDLKAAGGLESGEKAAYLTAIVDVIQNATQKGGYDEKKLKRRFQCISNCPKTTGKTGTVQKGYMVAVMMIYITLFCASYSVVFQSQFDVPMEEMTAEENIILLEPETVYLQEREGRYEVIYENECISVVDKNAALLMKEDGFEIR